MSARQILRIEAAHYTAALVFVYDWVTTQWVCRRAAPIVKWHIGHGAAEVLAYCHSRGFRCEWIEGV